MRKFWGVMMIVLGVILILVALISVAQIIHPSAGNPDADAGTFSYKLGEWVLPIVLILLAIFLFVKGLKLRGVQTSKINFTVRTGKDVDYEDDYSNQPPSI